MATQIKTVFVLLAASLLLAACSSKPSPWSQSSSPWAGKNAQTEEMAAEEQAAGGFVEPMPAEQMAYEPLEPVAAAPIEPMEPMEPVAPLAAEPVMPMMAEPEEPVVMAQDMAVAGDLKSQPATYFAVQVVASRSMKQLSAFAKRHQLSEQWTAQTSVKGETWFVLMEGVYATRAEARDALNRISSQVNTKPWIRSVGSLQAVMQ